MHPVEIILTAIISGATESSKATTTISLTQAYDELTTLLSQYIQQHPDISAGTYIGPAHVVITKYRQGPIDWHRTMADVLVTTEAHRNESIMGAAGVLMARLPGDPVTLPPLPKPPHK